jgi:hypothetical protein
LTHCERRRSSRSRGSRNIGLVGFRLDTCYLSKSNAQAAGVQNEAVACIAARGQACAPTHTESGTASATSGALLSTSPTQSNTASSDDGTANKGNGESSNNTPAIVGGVIGGLALVLGSVIALVYLLRHNCARRPNTSNGEKDQQGGLSPSDAAWKYPAGGWGPGELAADSLQAPAELPAYRFNRGPAAPPVELPAPIITRWMLPDGVRTSLPSRLCTCPRRYVTRSCSCRDPFMWHPSEPSRDEWRKCGGPSDFYRRELLQKSPHSVVSTVGDRQCIRKLTKPR